MPTPRDEPPPASAPPQQEISESAAISLVGSYIESNHYYNTGNDCIRVMSAGYRNRGYTLLVNDTCDPHVLGRWRIDAVTREIFRQRDDGRYVRP